MKQEYIEKFECKIKLNKVIDELHMNKSDFDYIVKHILKSNVYLKRHYDLFKNYVDDMLDKCNFLLNLDFFVSDKTLIIWIARLLNKVIKENNLSDVFKQYLKDKSDNLKGFGYNRYDKQKSLRTVISCDDDCFEDYLPLRESSKYYTYDEEKDILYPQFDEELSKYESYGRNKLNKNEILNIKNFRFQDIDEQKLLSQLDKYRLDFHQHKNDEYYYGDDVNYNILQYIRKFENVHIFPNIPFFFDIDIINARDIFKLMKKGEFNYTVNDDYFIVDIDGNNVKYDEKISVKSLMDFTNLIDFPMWINYMNAHDIGDLSEMYFEKMYDEIDEYNY